LSDIVDRVMSFLTMRGGAYRQALGSPAGKIILADLAVFCRANESCAVPGDRDRTMMLEGRREVWLRISHHMNLSPEQLYALFGGPKE
jgi:hypothetical protein